MTSEKEKKKKHQTSSGLRSIKRYWQTDVKQEKIRMYSMGHKRGNAIMSHKVR